ncbi:cuticle protein 70, isoforms A and B-like [Anthonomus grandis grandis]|uniref:cuticle protein 70, isoforms A and B-like n=1 Tax=Anthonomus grandis grandis TaxID=2921223 RepID=UPI0021656914|nr:cuticle protein 70, isoforms A and B-like [Anthonomus grandis grandis]
MFKIAIALSALFCLASAGYLGEPLAYHAPIVAAPIIKAHVPVATSYQNSVQISSAHVPIVVKTPVVAAPVIKAAPLIAAPVHYAPAPTIIKSPLIAAPYPYLH